METVIVICLLIIIALLLHDKVIVNRSKKQKKQEKINPNLPDVMGQPKLVKSLLMSDNTNKSQKKESEKEMDNFNIEINKEEDIIQIQQEDLEDVFRNTIDLEEEWNRYGISSGDIGFAQGVTFEELSSVGMLLQKDKLELSQKETAVAIVQKIQGTELLSLLENSMESASRKIAELLDGRLSSEMNSSSSYLRKNDLSDFDIGEFM